MHARSEAEGHAGHASLAGYMTVWAICGITALVAALFLATVHATDARRAVV